MVDELLPVQRPCALLLTAIATPVAGGHARVLGEGLHNESSFVSGLNCKDTSIYFEIIFGDLIYSLKIAKKNYISDDV